MTARANSSRSTKRAVNVSLDAEMVEQARDLGINLSRLLEGSLSEALQEARQRRWRQENQAAIGEYNTLIAERGSFGDRRRRF